MIGPQSLLKVSQALRSAVPARSLTIVSAPAAEKVSKTEFAFMCTLFGVAVFGYPTYVLHTLAQKRNESLRQKKEES